MNQCLRCNRLDSLIFVVFSHSSWRGSHDIDVAISHLTGNAAILTQVSFCAAKNLTCCWSGACFHLFGYLTRLYYIIFQSSGSEIRALSPTKQFFILNITSAHSLIVVIQLWSWLLWTILSHTVSTTVIVLFMDTLWLFRLLKQRKFSLSEGLEKLCDHLCYIGGTAIILSLAPILRELRFLTGAFIWRGQHRSRCDFKSMWWFIQEAPVTLLYGLPLFASSVFICGRPMTTTNAIMIDLVAAFIL